MSGKSGLNINIKISEVNKMSIECQREDNVQYAYYIYKDGENVAKFRYSSKNTATYWLSESGEYSVKVFVIDETGSKISQMSDAVVFDAEKAFGINADKKTKKIYFWERIIEIVTEIFTNRAIILRMAAFDYKLENKDTYLGKIWALFTPLIQIGTYWLVFGIGLRSGRDVDGYPYLAWMLIGLIPWFFIKDCIVNGANAIYSKIGLIEKMKFPVSTIPISKILQELYSFFVMLIIMVVILLCLGLRPDLYWLNLTYYIIYSIVFLTSISLITSVITMVARDFYKLLNSLIRLLFYVTPILWVMDNMPQIYQTIMEYNPIYYVVKGFRESILYDLMFYHEMRMVVIMWGVNIVLFAAGCVLQSKFKNKFIDLI